MSILYMRVAKEAKSRAKTRLIVTLTFQVFNMSLHHSNEPDPLLDMRGGNRQRRRVIEAVSHVGPR